MSKENDDLMVQFEDYEIRRVWDEKTEQWYFAVVDVISALSDSANPNKYWHDMKRREKGIELSAICRKFKMKAANGRKYQTECANVESLLRIIQSIPSPKAEPFKQWLARVGRERLEEIADPELAAQRAREYFRRKGYSDEWIETRLRGVDIRNELTGEWKKRGVKEGVEYAILTDEISKGTFDITTSEHKQLKQLKRQNLRDHMTNAELVFTMLGELTTTEIARKEDVQGFSSNKDAAEKGGKVAGDARRNFEQTTGSKVVSKNNYLEQSESNQLSPGGEEKA